MILVQHKIDKDSILYAESLLATLPQEREEQIQYRQLYQLVIDLQKANRTLFDLNPEEIVLLTNIANSSTKTAYKAQTLLYAYNGTEYPVILPYLADGNTENTWITLFKNDVGSTQIQPLTPNPSSETSYLHYEIAEQTTAVFELYDLTGRLLLQQTLRGKGTYSLSAANYSSGMYLYRISIAGKSMYQNKWLITK